MMTPEELAHWMYRVKALEPEVKGSQETEKTYRYIGRMSLIFGMDHDYWNDAADEIVAKREPNKWLLQEALYKIELGKVLNA
jgi:hypothetical protein